MILIQANFLKAYKDVEAYLKEIGGTYGIKVRNKVL